MRICECRKAPLLSQTSICRQRRADFCAISRLVNEKATWFWLFQNTCYAITKANIGGIPKLHSGVIDVSNVWRK